MKCFIINKIDDHYVITTEELTVSSPQFQWLKKNGQVFTSESAANEYVMSKLEEKNENRFEKLVNEYDNIETRKEFEKLFDVKLDDGGYERLKSFIDYLRK